MKKIIMTCMASLWLVAGSAFAQGVVLVENSVSIDNSQGYARIVGEAVNNSKDVVGSVFISFNLYDQQDRQVGNAIANLSNVAPGGKVRFGATANVQDFAYAKFVKITEY
ncbi:FxLYD domain-containing protein [Salinicola endophyticus]|uniref:FxLYD domain-containing protein n=1 Tax=Salinicola endophyticus TaxID=1949083 RepID=A0AB74UEN0_9GAMM